jgi:hypothetical protein
MVLHLPHPEGGFGVIFNDVTKDAVFDNNTLRFVVWHGAFSQERQDLWLSKDDRQESSSWSSSPLLLLIYGSALYLSLYSFIINSTR